MHISFLSWLLYFISTNSYVVNPIMIKCYVHMNQKVISCRVASAVVALEGIFLGNNHSNREAQCLVRKDMGPWTIIIAVATPVPDSQHKQTNKHSRSSLNAVIPVVFSKWWRRLEGQWCHVPHPLHSTTCLCLNCTIPLPSSHSCCCCSFISGGSYALFLPNAPQGLDS